MTLEVIGSNPILYHILQNTILFIQHNSKHKNSVYNINTYFLKITKKLVFFNSIYCNTYNTQNRFLGNLYNNKQLNNVSYKYISIVFNFKRTLRFNITLLNNNKNIMWLTFRKNIDHNLKTLSIKSRWVIHTFFLFKNIHFILNKKSVDVICLFYKTNALLFDSLKLFLENFYFFLKNFDYLFTFIFVNNFSGPNLNTFKKIKSIKKFKRKIYEKSNRLYLSEFFKMLV